MDECFNFAVNLHTHKRMVGTRQVLSEQDEIQPNGKTFIKWDMGAYHWKSYIQVRMQQVGIRQIGVILTLPRILFCLL